MRIIKKKVIKYPDKTEVVIKEAELKGKKYAVYEGRRSMGKYTKKREANKRFRKLVRWWTRRKRKRKR